MLGIMAHRPYPDRTRALRQIARHYPPPPLAEQGGRPAGGRDSASLYVLATRRPSVVSGGQ